MVNNKSKEEGSFYLMKRLFRDHIKPQARAFQLCVLSMVIIALATALNAWLMQPVLDEIFVQKNTEMLYIVPLLVIINSLIKSAAGFFQTSTMKKISQKILTDIQLRLYSHLIYADMAFLDEHPAGNLLSRFTNDINAMRKSVSDVITGGVMEFCTLFGLVGVMLYQSFDLALIVVFILPLTFLPIIKLGRRMRKVAKGIQEELGGFTVRLDETFQNARIIKSYCREEYEISRARKIISRFLELYKKAAYVESASSPILEMFGAIVISIIVWYGGKEVIAGHTTPGAFFSFITALLMSYRPLKSISNLNTAMQEGLAASRRLFNILDQEIIIKDKPNVAKIKFPNYNIEFKGVSFCYKNANKILDQISMSIPQGKTVALVGSSGSGKTTIFNLLQRFYSPDEGVIAIAGHDITEVRLKTLREKIALVSQEVTLFDDTIIENIRYGKLDATEEEIIDAALAAAAHDFIVNLPEGYYTQIGQKGLRLSGGQRQRIAIARAILKNAPILLMDEATSALDAISEKQVQMALEYLKKGRTTIVIAHRLSTIETADLIYVVSEGKISESGTHQELLQNGGEYHQLYQQYKSHIE